MNAALDAGGRPREDIRLDPPLPARERYGREWGVVFLKPEEAPAGNSVERHSIGRPAISWSDGVVRVRDPQLFDSANRGLCRAFMERAFRLHEVRSVELDWAEGMAAVHYHPRGLDAAGILEKLAGATRGETLNGTVPEVEPWTPLPGTPRHVRWFRHGRRLSTIEVASEVPGRIRFRHPKIAGDQQFAHRLEAELMSVHGVTEAHARPLTGSLLVRFDPELLDNRSLVQLVEDFCQGAAAPAESDVHPPAVAFGLANTSVGLALAGELAIPALLPASAVLLVVSNGRVIRESVRELRKGQVGLPLLNTAIVAGTLGTGQFLGAAMMSWMFKFWRRRHRLDQLAIRRQLLPSLTQRPRFARLRAGSGSVTVATDRLREGDRIIVELQEIIPVDGRLLSDDVVVDERLVTGISGLTRKRSGDRIYAGSWPLEGSLEVEVSVHGEASRVARIGRALAAAMVSMPAELAVTARGEAFARRAVAPTLAAAGVGFLVGDLVTASAILRPDYGTGPGVGTSLELLRDVAAAARDGVVIRDATALERLAEADVWVFDYQPALLRTGVEVGGIEGQDENRLLQLAATAYHDLADERAIALQAACLSGGISLLPIEPSYRGLSIVLHDTSTCITVLDAQAIGGTSVHPSLDVAVDGRLAGRIRFRTSPISGFARAVGELRRNGPITLGLLSDHLDSAGSALAMELGLDFHHAAQGSAAKADFLRACRNRGLKVAFVGDCQGEPLAAREAHVAISLADEFDPERDAGHILALRKDFTWLPALRERSLAHTGLVRTIHKSILIPNLLCVAGAFFLGFTSVSAVVITNLGTWAIYSGLPRRRPHRAAIAFSIPGLRP
jgi:cation transport ATPase